MLELIIKAIIKYFQEQRRLAEERLRAARSPMALPVLAEPPRKKKKEKKHHAQQHAVAEAPVRAQFSESTEAALPVFEAASEPLQPRRDLSRLFVLGEIMGPPLALREDAE